MLKFWFNFYKFNKFKLILVGFGIDVIEGKLNKFVEMEKGECKFLYRILFGFCFMILRKKKKRKRKREINFFS